MYVCVCILFLDKILYLKLFLNHILYRSTYTNLFLQLTKKYFRYSVIWVIWGISLHSETCFNFYAKLSHFPFHDPICFPLPFMELLVWRAALSQWRSKQSFLRETLRGCWGAFPQITYNLTFWHLLEKKLPLSTPTSRH